MFSSISEKGQVTVPKALRDRYGLKPGTRVEFCEIEGAIVLRRESRRSLADHYGTLKLDKSTDEAVRELRGE